MIDRAIKTARLLAAVLVAWPTPGSADANKEDVIDHTRGDFTLGVSAAAAILEDDSYGALGSIEITGTIEIVGVQVWVSNGYRFRFHKEVNVFLYYEAGFWALFNLGAGVSIGFANAQPFHFHLFAGLPLPLFGITEGGLFPGVFVEPYYRPMLGFRQPGEEDRFLPELPDPSAEPTGFTEHWIHEVGIMLKLTSVQFRWPWQ